MWAEHGWIKTLVAHKRPSQRLICADARDGVGRMQSVVPDSLGISVSLVWGGTKVTPASVNPGMPIEYSARVGTQ